MKRTAYDAWASSKGATGKIVWCLPLLIMGAMIFFSSSQAIAQDRYTAAGNTVKGQVIDSATGYGLDGVTVAIEGTSTKTISDKDGNFSLTAGSSQPVVVLSLIGYREVRVPYNGASAFSVRLAAIDASLNQVIVVGYGTQKKTTLTGSVAMIKGSELTVTKNENVFNMMTGKVPGVRILQRSSEPGAYDNVFDIRGMQGNPLVVIDGVPRSVGDLSRMEPNEIESISVLKDASAAIYGVRAANGVVLVTTKKGVRGQNGKFDITYNINQSWQQFPSLPKGTDAIEFMTMKNEAQKRGFNNFIQQTPPFRSDADIELFRNGTLKSSDWIGATMNDWAPETQHTLSVNGGSDKVNYFFNLGYFKQNGLFKTGDMNYDRWNFRSNVDAKITDRLRAHLLVSGYSDTKNQPGGRSVWELFKYTWSQMPIDQIYANNNPDYPHVEPDNANPVVISNSDIVGYQTYKNRNFQGQLGLDYDLPGVKGLTAKAMYNYGFNISDNTQVKRAYNLYEYDPQNDTYNTSLVAFPSNTNRSYWNTTNTIFQLSLNYNRKFANTHNVGALLLYEENNSKGDNFSASRNFSLGIPYLFAGDAADQVGSMDGGGLYETVNKGMVGRVTYDFKGKYLAEFSFRNDGSSKFRPGIQWGFFPAGSVGWRLSEESFIQHLISPYVLNNLKIRASYGKTADDNAGAFQYVPGYNYPAQGYIINGSYVNGLSSRGVVNPDLTWYTTKMYNLGLDFDLWHGLLGGTVDVFRNKREGVPANRLSTLPGTVGANLPQENLNSDQTQGIELLLTHRGKIRQFSYNISGNVSTVRRKTLIVQQTRAGNSYDNWKNSQQDRNTNIWWGKQFLGQFTSYDQIYNYNVNTGGGNQSKLPGDYYYADLNNDGVIDGKDEVPIATRDIPLINFGMTLGGSWKGFDMNVLLQGAAQFHVEYDEQLSEPLTFQRNSLTQFLDRWHTLDPKADVYDPNTVWVPGYYATTGTPKAEGTRAVQNAAYVRIKSLEIGYTLPRKWLSKVGIGNVRIYANSYNLATFTGLKFNDPEHPGKVADGADWNAAQAGYKYPMNRTFSAGANVTF